MSNYFFTLVDQNFVLRALTLYKSFKTFNRKRKFIIVTLDDNSFKLVKKFKDEDLISLNVLDFDLRIVKKIKETRTYKEYCWTMKSIAFSYILDNFKGITWLFYLDSDSMVFSKFKSLNDKKFDALLSPHRPSNNFFKKIVKNVGRFNAGFLGIKNNINGRKILKYWKNLCIESCIELPYKNEYGDQKYLSELPKKFLRININPNNGLNVAPWNLCDERNIISDKNLPRNLIFYHMQGFKIYNLNTFNLYSDDFFVCKNVFRKIYLPYINLLRKTYNEIKKKDSSFFQRKEFKIDIKFLMKKIISGIGNFKLKFFYEK